MDPDEQQQGQEPAQPQTEQQPAADPAQAADPAPPADPTPAPADDEDGDDEPELTAAEWQQEAGKARKQAAKFRTERNTAREQLATAQARIVELEAAASQPPAQDPAQEAEARAQASERRALIAETAAETGVPAALIKAFGELTAAADEAAIATALGKIKGFLAPPAAGAHLPPSDPSTAPSLDQQIADAIKRGDTAASIRLKSQKLTGA